MFSKATRGLGLPSMVLTSIEPMMANCTNCSGVQSTLAPRSSTCTWPWMVGKVEIMAGRSMPGSVLSTNRAVAINAPVLPALTHALATPALTRLMATRMDESFLVRNACAGASSMPTTCEAW